MGNLDLKRILAKIVRDTTILLFVIALLFFLGIQFLNEGTKNINNVSNIKKDIPRVLERSKNDDFFDNLPETAFRDKDQKDLDGDINNKEDLGDDLKIEDDSSSTRIKIFVILGSLFLVGYFVIVVINIKRYTDGVICNLNSIDDFVTEDKPKSADESFNKIRENLKQRKEEINIEREKNEKQKELIKLQTLYINHDIKTPLTIINTTVDTMEKLDDVEKLKSRLIRIKTQANKIREYLDALENAVEGAICESKDGVRINILDLTKRLSYFGTEFANSNECSLLVDDRSIKSGEVIISIDAMEKCLIHLLSNAFKYSTKQVKIEFSSNDFYTIKIIDDGKGFNEEELTKAKELFYTNNQNRNNQKGYGIGLYYVDMYVKSIGGAFKLENGSDGGAIAIIEIPLLKINNTK